MIRNTNFIKFALVAMGLFMAILTRGFAQDIKVAEKGLHFTSLPQKWDEAIPLGNGTLGALIYEKEGVLRIALDRSDLWDLRPIEGFKDPKFSYAWIDKQVLAKDYKPVQDFVNASDIKGKAPTKIPGGAIEFPIKNFGKIAFVNLNVITATCTIQWESGTKATIFISATQPIGYFRFENLPANYNDSKLFSPELLSPAYQNLSKTDNKQMINLQGLATLGYKNGEITKEKNAIYYHQKGWQDFSYDIALSWKSIQKHAIEGSWSITSKGSPYSSVQKARDLVSKRESLEKTWQTHKDWWESYWAKSAIEIPDTILMQQYYMNMYLFGSASRKGGPPISLQAVWTADDGKLPPWKGDFHNDLNTQLSYWPGYTSNHMEESSAFTDWLWKILPAAKKYTSHVFKNEGLNVPGVVTLSGQPMDAWLQYSTSPTISCWLAQHFYWQWIYAGDEKFLRENAYPWLKGVATHIERIAVKDKSGKWKLPISSSPEFFDNSLKAWFLNTTNYDLSLIRWTLQTTIQMADKLQLHNEVTHWRQFLKDWPELAVKPTTNALMVAPNLAYEVSHRHFSHLMSIYPLQTVDWYNGVHDQKIINASLTELEKNGPSLWVGYSYVWQSCLQSMKQDGEEALKALKIYATAFCSPNTFHLNGDQSGKGYSNFKYRPFTLEANFAFLKAVQLMLIQQHNGINYIFPAMPNDWKDASFKQLRVPGGFLVSAKREGGKVVELQIKATADGMMKMKNPFLNEAVKTFGLKTSLNIFNQEVISLQLAKGQEIKINR